MKNELTPEQVTDKLKGVGSNTLLTHRRRMMNKHGVTGAQIDAELHRRVAADTAKRKKVVA